MRDADATEETDEAEAADEADARDATRVAGAAVSDGDGIYEIS